MSRTAAPIPTPSKDPVPWVTTRLRGTGIAGGPANRMDGETAARLLDVLTSSVAALQDDTHPYRVVLSSGGTAATDLANRIVQVSAEAMFDVDLTPGQRASILMGLVLHEVGHIRYHRDTLPLVQATFGQPTRALSSISNIAADLHDERLAKQAFPGAADCVGVTLWYVGGKGQKARRSLDAALTTYAGRINALVGITRYPFNVVVDTPAAERFARWARAWARRCERSHTAAAHVARIREALNVIGHPDETPDEPDEPTPPQRGDKQGQPGQGTPQPGQGEPSEGEPEEGEGEGSGEGDEQGEGEGSGSGSDEGEGDDDADGSGGGDGESDEPSDSDVDGDDDWGDDTHSPGSTGGGSIKPRDLAAEQDTDIDPADACTGQKARQERDWNRDASLQDGAQRHQKGQRESRNRRTYKHPEWSHEGGRLVARIVWDERTKSFSGVGDR